MQVRMQEGDRGIYPLIRLIYLYTKAYLGGIWGNPPAKNFFFVLVYTCQKFLTLKISLEGYKPIFKC